jgi:tetratricopeptide (TPR) repeat protein
VGLEEGVNLHPGSETEHTAQLSFRQALAAVSLQSQGFKSGAREVRLLVLDHACDIVRDLKLHVHTAQLSHFPRPGPLRVESGAFAKPWPSKQEKLGPEHRPTLVTAENLADVLREEGKLAEAETLTRETLAIERRTLGNDHSDTQETVLTLEQLLTAQGYYAEAEPLLRVAYDTQLRILGRDHSHTAEAAYNLGALYAAEGKKEEAMARLTSAVDHGLSAKLDLELATDTQF